MKAEDRPRFDIDALRGLAGAKAFARGEEYYRDGLVQILGRAGARAGAGGGLRRLPYRITGRGKEIDGDAPALPSRIGGFCKHMVATALAANEADGDAEAEGAGVLSRIRDHLKGKGVDALVEMIVDLAERDPACFASWRWP